MWPYSCSSLGKSHRTSLHRSSVELPLRPPTPHPRYLCCRSSVVFTAQWFLLFLTPAIVTAAGGWVEMKKEMERTSQGLKTGVCRALGLLPCGIGS